MINPFYTKLAELAINYSLDIKKGDRVVVEGPVFAQELFQALYAEIIKAGGFPLLQPSIEGELELLFKYGTEEQKKKRSAAIQEGYKTAASVPMETARTCGEILDVAKVIANKGNQNSITDAAVSALMTKAGVEGAILNVRINLNSIKDESSVKKIFSEINDLQKNTEKKTKEIMDNVNSKM